MRVAVRFLNHGPLAVLRDANLELELAVVRFGAVADEESSGAVRFRRRDDESTLSLGSSSVDVDEELARSGEGGIRGERSEVDWRALSWSEMSFDFEESPPRRPRTPAAPNAPNTSPSS